MAVESATLISQLNSSFPAGSEPRSQGDDHLRLIKSVLLADGQSSTKLQTTTIDDTDGGFNQVNFPILTGEQFTTPANRKLQYYYGRVERYGGDPTGVNDSKEAIDDAIASVVGIGNSGTAQIGYGGRLPVDFTDGIWKITGDIDLTGRQHVELIGHGAAIKPSVNTIKCFKNVSYGTIIKGLNFIQGHTAIEIFTNNLDTSMILIEDCEFHDQQNYGIISVAPSNSTMVVIRFCKAILDVNITPATCVFCDLGVDGADIYNVRITSNCDVTFINRGFMKIKDLQGVPRGTGKLWVENRGDLQILHSRFGGESGGARIVDNHQSRLDTTPTQLTVKDCEATYSPGSEYAFVFYAIPNKVEISGNVGLPDQDGIFFDATIPAADISNIKRSESTWLVKNNAQDTLPLSGNQEAITRLTLLHEWNDSNVTLQMSDKVSQTSIDSGGAGAASTTTNVNQVNSTNMFAAFAYDVTATTAAWLWNRKYTTLLSGLGLGTGKYTFVFEIDCITDDLFIVTPVASEQTRNMELTQGHHVISFPFFFDGTNGTEIGVTVSGSANSQNFKIANYRIFRGWVKINTANNILYNAAAAAPTTLQWEVGDIIKNLTYTPDGNNMVLDHRVCSTKGTPGTWQTQYISTVTPAT